MRSPSKSIEDTEDGWLALRRGGMVASQIAGEAGVSKRHVQRGIKNALAREPKEGTSPKSRPGPRLVIAYGASCKPLALLRCDDVHPHGPMPKGTICCCAHCHETGIEGHPAFHRDPDTDPKPEPKAPPRPLTKPRKQGKRPRTRAVA